VFITSPREHLVSKYFTYNNSDSCLLLFVAAETNAMGTSSLYQHSAKDMNIQKIRDRANVRSLSVFAFLFDLKGAMFMVSLCIILT